MLCIVVATRGSTPQQRGAKMLVLADGTTIGTLGGGCVEAEVRQQALQLLQARQSKLLDFKLDHDYGWDDGLICGGVMQIATQFLTSIEADSYRALVDGVRNRQRIEFSARYILDGSEKEYREALGPPPTLLIAGAGHVGQALAEVAGRADFDVVVIDDRADCASAERFPAARRIVGEIEDELRRFPIDGETYIVIVTRGHRHDGRALQSIIDSSAKYVGLIGSKAKVKLIFDDLLAQGVAQERLLNVRAPIGLDIGAVTVEEIAISIAAELIAVRRTASINVAKQMKIPAGELRAWLARSR